MLAIGGCTVRQCTPNAPPPFDLAAEKIRFEEARERQAKEREERAWATAQSTAVEAVHVRLKDPSSFELVGTNALRGTVSGQPGWIVGVTYRSTNSFGGVVPGHAIVSVDDSGDTAIEVAGVD